MIIQFQDYAYLFIKAYVHNTTEHVSFTEHAVSRLQKPTEKIKKPPITNQSVSR